ncbi:hypothetical protein NTJ56_33795 [Burkholderia contaminans]|nr:hypothetical protein NTJ56_33795 [Burkholderia contaminans]
MEQRERHEPDPGADPHSIVFQCGAAPAPVAAAAAPAPDRSNMAGRVR